MLVFFCIKTLSLALASVAQLLECHPVHQKVVGLISGQGTYLGFGFNPKSRHIYGQPIDVSLSHQSSLFLSLISSLSKINKHIFN